MRLIESQTKALPDQDPTKIFIGGFSQGCGVALAAYEMYQGTKPLGGVFGLSGMQRLSIDLKPVYRRNVDVQR